MKAHSCFQNNIFELTNNVHSQFCSGDRNINLVLVSEKSKSFVHPHFVVAAIFMHMARPHGRKNHIIGFAA